MSGADFTARGLECCFHVNASKHLTAKGFPAAVIQPAVWLIPANNSSGNKLHCCCCFRFCFRTVFVTIKKLLRVIRLKLTNCGTPGPAICISLTKNSSYCFTLVLQSTPTHVNDSGSHMRMLKNILVFSEEMSHNSADLIPWSEWPWMTDADPDIERTHPISPRSLYSCSIQSKKTPLKKVDAPKGAN